MKTAQILFWLLVVVFVHNPTSISAQQPLPNDLRVTLQRSICYGTCPDYTLTILDNGDVKFEGREFVKTKGSASSHISQGDLTKLITAIEAASFFSLKDKYTTEDDGCPEVSTDNPTVILAITLRGQTKAVQHYHGCQGQNAVFPKALTELEDQIDAIAGSKRWIK